MRGIFKGFLREDVFIYVCSDLNYENEFLGYKFENPEFKELCLVILKKLGNVSAFVVNLFKIQEI